MEFKLLSDQLNSAFEDVTTLQGNVYTLQDEVMPLEPAFSGIQRITSIPTKVLSNGKIQYAYVYTRINKSVEEKIKKISKILPYCYPNIRFDDSEVEYLGMPHPNPNEYNFWKIKMCSCGNFKENFWQSRYYSCACPEFDFSVKSLEDGIVLEDCFSDLCGHSSVMAAHCPAFCPAHSEISGEEEEDDGQVGPSCSKARTITSSDHPFKTYPPVFETERNACKLKVEEDRPLLWLNISS
eukprot:GHVP01050738.1.p1 GENE.GHVP01050738.1~~GHVP01050738.1.p1  ORF type:complete len:239 (+),score=29.14 GHVP01050738.1:42-758(+)